MAEHDPTADELAAFIRARLDERTAAQPARALEVAAIQIKVGEALARVHRGDDIGYEALLKLAAR